MNFKNILVGILFFFFSGLNLLSANDDPCTATTIVVNDSCNPITFSNATSTNTVTVPDPACAGYNGGDIWFTFTMPNYGYHTIIELSSGVMTDGGMAVYSGTDCNNLSLVSCDDNSGVGNMPMIRVDDGCGFEFSGATFWVRVWENGNDNNGTFDICAYATSPVVPAGVAACGGNLIAGDACCDAILLGVDMDGYCGNTGSYTDIPDEIPGFCAFIDNNSWLSFVASEDSINISITSSNCTYGNGIQVAILETDDCTNFNVVSNCWNPGSPASGNLIGTGLTVGETYYILVDGWASDICDYTLGIVYGVETVSVSADEYEICQGESTQIHADVIGSGSYSYNWSPSTTLDDPTSANPIATPNVSTDYTVTITGISDSIHTISIIVYPGAPGTPSIAGPTSVCETSNQTAYKGTATDASIYNWTVTGDGIITSGNGSDSIYIDWGPGGGEVCVTAENNCGVSAQQCQNIMVNGLPDITATDPAPACAPDVFDLSTIMISNAGSGTGLISYYDNLADAENGTNDLLPPHTTNSGTFYIRMETGPDCYDIDDVEVVFEEPELLVINPGTRCSPDFVDLDDVVINEVNGYPGGSKTYFADSLNAVNGSPQLSSTEVYTGGIYWVRYETPGSCFTVAPIVVNIDISPDISIQQPAPLCPGGSIDLDTISFTEANGATFTKYFFNNLSFATLGLNTLALSNTVVTMPQTYYLRAETANNCFQIVEIIITAGVTPEGNISGGGTYCPGSIAEIIFSLNGSGPFDVVYTDGTNNFTLNGISDNYTTSITVDSDTTFSLVSISDANGCSGNLLGSDVQIFQADIPTAEISGSTTLCGLGTIDLDFIFSGEGPFDVAYSDGTDSYNLSGVNSPDTANHNITGNTTFNLISVSDVNNCAGLVSGNAEFIVYPALEISNISENCNGDYSMYTVSFEISGGDDLTYQVNGGAGILSGNLFTSNPIPSGTAYSFTVSEDSGCEVQNVNGVQNCSCATDAGQMDPNMIVVCEDETATATFIDGSNYLNPGDIFHFVLHDSAGNSPGNIIAVADVPEFDFQAGMVYGQTYYISPVAGPDDGSGNIDENHFCYSFAEGTPVTFYEIPDATISGNATICSGSNTNLIFNFNAGIAPFEVVLFDGNNSITINNLQDGDTYSVSPTSTTSYTILSVTDSSPAFCQANGNGNVTVNVNEAPEINNVQYHCNNTNTQFQVSFEITGGDPGTYEVIGSAGTLDGITNIFTSDFIDNETAYSFIIDDINSCDPAELSGTYICECTSNAGEMEFLLIEACEDEMAVGQHNDSEMNLDGDDALGYILYDQSVTLPGAIMLTSPTPAFSYDPSLTYGTTYYIAAVVADDSGTGFPVLDSNIDPCLSVSNGQPIIFFQEPEISISGDNTICEDESSNIIFNIIGSGLFDVTYSDGTNDYTLLGIGDGHEISLNPDETTTYNLVAVNSNSGPLCTGIINPVNSSVTITVLESPEISNVITDCNEDGTSYTVTFEINGGDLNAYTVAGSPGTLTGNVFTSDLLIGGSTYNFMVSDGSGCPPVILTDIEYCNCTPDIKPEISLDLEVSCNGASDGALNVSNENGQAPFSFQWSEGGVGEEVNNLASGWHYVTMTDGNNCASIDSFFLEEPEPILSTINILEPTCFGENNGEIIFENTSGGTNPYSFAIGIDGSFTENRFYNLSAGTYLASIEDSNGCKWEETINITEPEEFIIDIGDDRSIELGDNIMINPYTSMPTNDFNWSPDAFLECPDCWSQVLNPTESIVYTLSATNQEGCQATDRVSITVNKERPIFIPNIFTPNGDGDNDIFMVYSGGGVEVIPVFKIYDRWGALIYEALDILPEDIDFGWDGFYNGEEVSQGVYVYFLEVVFKDGQKEIIKGDVTLMR